MKLNLHADQKKIHRYISDRIRDYPDDTNLGPGDGTLAKLLLAANAYMVADVNASRLARSESAVA